MLLLLTRLRYGFYWDTTSAGAALLLSRRLPDSMYYAHMRQFVKVGFRRGIQHLAVACAQVGMYCTC
jgi:hypothetical protein